MNQLDTDPLLTVEELADYLSIPRQSVYILRHRRKAPPAIKFGGSVRFRKSAVDTWLKDREEVLP
jgi:excisionase family DNA binding protein